MILMLELSCGPYIQACQESFLVIKRNRYDRSQWARLQNAYNKTFVNTKCLSKLFTSGEFDSVISSLGHLPCAYVTQAGSLFFSYGYVLSRG
jgi:hypothetical protein